MSRTRTNLKKFLAVLAVALLITLLCGTVATGAEEVVSGDELTLESETAEDNAPVSSEEKKQPVGGTVATAVSVGVILICGGVGVWYFAGKRKRQGEPEDGDPSKKEGDQPESGAEDAAPEDPFAPASEEDKKNLH